MILTPFLMDVAKVVARIRPDWPIHSIHRALCNCPDRTEAEIALAAVRCAADPDTKAPARITMHGPWWLPVDNTDRKPHLAEARVPPPYRREDIRAVPVPDGWKQSVLADISAARAARPQHLEDQTAEEASSGE